MIVFLPCSTIAECVDFIAQPHLMRVALNCQIVSTVINETNSLAAELQDHPSVTMWRGHETFLVAYGLACIDRYLERAPEDQHGHDVHAALQREMDLAMTEGYDPSPPSFMGNALMHGRFKRYLATEAPHLYYGHLDEIGHWDYTLFAEHHG